MRRHPLRTTAWLLLAALQSGALQAEPDPRKVAEDFFRGVYACNPSAVEALASDDIVVSYPIFETLFGTPAIRGREAVLSFANGFCSRWAEAEVTIHEAIADEGKVVLVWSFSARNVGSTREDEPPTSERRRWGGMTLYYLDSNGKITAEIGEESEPGPIARSAIAARR